MVVVVWGTHCLLENFALGLTRASSGRLERRSSVAEAVTTFLHATVSAQRNYTSSSYRVISHPAAYAWVCKTKQLFFFSFFCLGGVLCPKISLSIPTDGLITGLLRHAGMLVCAALRQREAARHGYKYLTTNHVHTLSQGCTSPAATRTATTGKFSATRAEGSAGALTSTAERWWAPESMATQTAVSNPQDNPQSSLWAFFI